MAKYVVQEYWRGSIYNTTLPFDDYEDARDFAASVEEEPGVETTIVEVDD